MKKPNQTINISSYGTVQPRTQSNLFPQVSGQIVQVNKNFNDGGFFEQGDVLSEFAVEELKLFAELLVDSVPKDEWSSRRPLNETDRSALKSWSSWPKKPGTS